jgi:5-formyltetrahydrofolate cyclo-ligase
VYSTLKTLDAYANAKRISVFLSMPTGEIQTDAIVRDALGAGKDVFVPYLHKNPAAAPGLPARIMDMVRLRDLTDYESLQPDKWGIPSIDPATVPGRQRVLGDADAQHSDSTLLDLILMPGVAFDIQPDNGAVRRLGHGKGFYDYFLFRHRLKAASLGQQESPALLLGLALSEQFLSPSEGTVPVGPLDQPLDGLVLGNGEIKGPLAPAPLNKTA